MPACTFINAFKLGSLIDFAIDDQKERQGLFMPGSRLPIRPPDELIKSSTPLICLLAVNNENEAKVCDRLKDLRHRALTVASIFAPADIWRELDRLDAM
jgi:hypothetical protein